MAYVKTNWVDNTTPIDENNLNKIESGIKNNDINIGEENYDNTKTYEVGDIVRYNEKIYKCITAITTAENFDSSKWEQTNIVEIVQSEKSKIYELIEALSTPIVGEGENITLNDTAEKRFENFDIEGNSVQDGEPTPDEPVEVESCGDNINIFDKDNANIKNWYIDTSNKKIESGNSENRILIQEIKPNTTYTISKKLSTFIVATCTNMPTLNSSTTQAQRNDNATKIAIASGSSDKYLVVQFKTQADTLTEQEILNSIKIVEGTETGEYSPYGQGCINEVICNKNLVVEIQKGYWNNTGVFDSDNNFCSSKQIKVEHGKTYVGSLFDKNKKYVGKLVYTVFDKNKNFIRYSGEDTITIANNEKYVSLRTDTSQVSYVNNNNLLMQLEEGSTVTPYQEHQSQSYTIPTQQPMRAIGDIRDKFILKENGKWYERHNIKEVILTGNENWSQRNQGDGTNTITFNVNLLNVGAYGSNNVLCDKFAYEQNSSSGNEGIGFESTLVTQYIQINRNRLSSLNLAGFKAWLSNNNTKLYYVLKIPEDIECTSEQTEILSQIYIKAKSYKGVTHIYSNDAVSPNCYVEAVKDLTTLIQ